MDYERRHSLRQNLMLNISSSSKSQIEEEKVKATVSYINFVEMLL